MNPKFKLGDLVRKTKGSEWHGTVVGTYSTSLTPEGYAVESATERGSVQIYPAAALEPWAYEPDVDAATMLRLIKTIKYLVGIAERGEGRKIADDETPEQFVLGYVKRLEQTNQDASAERLEKALKDIRSLSSINSAMNPSPLALTVLLGDIHHIADAVLSKEKGNDRPLPGGSRGAGRADLLVPIRGEVPHENPDDLRRAGEGSRPMTTEAVVDAVACAICLACDENPDHQGDARGNEFRWQDYRDVALAAISAFTAAQQPTEGEEIMVNTPHGVFILPLHPSGLSSGPRFVVYVPELSKENSNDWTAKECTTAS